MSHNQSDLEYLKREFFGILVQLFFHQIQQGCSSQQCSNHLCECKESDANVCAARALLLAHQTLQTLSTSITEKMDSLNTSALLSQVDCLCPHLIDKNHRYTKSNLEPVHCSSNSEELNDWLNQLAPELTVDGPALWTLPQFTKINSPPTRLQLSEIHTPACTSGSIFLAHGRILQSDMSTPRKSFVRQTSEHSPNKEIKEDNEPIVDAMVNCYKEAKELLGKCRKNSFPKQSDSPIKINNRPISINLKSSPKPNSRGGLSPPLCESKQYLHSSQSSPLLTILSDAPIVGKAGLLRLRRVSSQKISNSSTGVDVESSDQDIIDEVDLIDDI